MLTTLRDTVVCLPCSRQLGGALFAIFMGIPAMVLLGGESGVRSWSVCAAISFGATIGTLASHGIQRPDLKVSIKMFLGTWLCSRVLAELATPLGLGLLVVGPAASMTGTAIFTALVPRYRASCPGVDMIVHAFREGKAGKADGDVEDALSLLHERSDRRT